ncbi:hypothetical protein [Rhodococcus jostii]|uniref:hypothetical protein n=1 Tax=Rhodococcus jostii TaxID=132919 RepID=UPI00365A2E83
MLTSGSVIISLLLIPLRSHPTATIFCWIATVAVFPPWISFQLMGYRIPAAALLSIAIVLVLQGDRKLSWRVADTMVSILALTSIVSCLSFHTPVHIMTQVLLEWAACYAAGRWMFEGADFRLVGNRIGGIVGWLAVLQALMQFNVANIYIFNMGVPANSWMALQERGGQVRSELTFGHSIALGAALTLLLPFALQRLGTLLDQVMVLGLLLGVVATFSRSAMVAAVIVVAISLLSSRSFGTTKVVGSILIVAIAWIGISVFTDTVSSSGNGVELTDSTTYREGLLDLVDIVGGIGLAQGGVPAADGVTYSWGRFYSIDNGLLYLGLYIGWVAVFSYVAILVIIVWRSTIRRWTPFSTALVGHIPFVLTVAPITQYQNIYWMMLGAGVSASYLGSHHTIDESTNSRRLTSAIEAQSGSFRR